MAFFDGLIEIYSRSSYATVLGFLFYAILTLLVLQIGQNLYNVSPLHPLAKFPGPFLAKLTSWYEFYWNVVIDGQYIFRIEEMHEKYGPIVRIGPNELHINDSSFYQTLYASSGYRFSKYPGHYKLSAQTEAGIGLMDSDVHKVRRGVLGPLFSTQSVRKLDPMIRKYIDIVVSRVGGTDNEKGFEISKIFRCLAVDIISEYAYSEGFETLKHGDLDAPFFVGMKNIVRMCWFFNWFYMLQDIMIAMPYSWIKRIVPPDALGVIDVQKACEDQVMDFVKNPEKAKAKNTHATIFEVMLTPDDSKSYRVPSITALKEEAWGVLAAGTETTANTLTVGIYEACRNLEIQEKLYNALKSEFKSMDDPITDVRCQQIPYLACFVKECLRSAPGVVGRLPRMVPLGGLVINGVHVPEDTIIGMSAYMMHKDLKIFPDAEKFRPERWADSAISEQYLVPFGKGSRSCLGINLAYAELYMTFGALFRRFKLGLHTNSTLSDTWVDNFVQKRTGELVVTVKKRQE